MNWLKRSWKFIFFLSFFTVVACWVVIPENMTLNLIVSTFCLLVMMGILFTKRGEILIFLKSRFFKSMISESTTVIFIFIILCLLNFIAYKKPQAIDISRQQVNSLSDQTKSLLAQLKQPLKIELFAKRLDWEKKMGILELFRLEKNNIRIEAIDIEKDIVRAQAAGVTRNNSIRLLYDNRSLVVELKNELSIVNGLIKLIRPSKKKIVFSSGHQEISLEKSGNEGLQFLLKGLENAHYEIHEFDLGKHKLDDTDLLMILGAKNDFTDFEITQISTFLENNGKLFLALDPNLDGEKLPQLKQMLAGFGISMRNDIVVDRLSSMEGQDPYIIIEKEFNQQHPITKGFEGRAIFPLCSSIFTNNDHYQFMPLIQSSPFPASWGELDLKGLAKGKALYDGADSKGPITVGTVGENKSGGKLALFSNSRFLLDGYHSQAINYNLVMNTISWLVDDDKIMSLKRPQLVKERIMISQKQMNLIYYFSLLFSPLILFGLAFYMYRRRIKL